MVLAAAGEKQLGCKVKGACTGKLESGVAFGPESRRGGLKSGMESRSAEQMFSSEAQSSPSPLTVSPVWAQPGAGFTLVG